MRFAICSLVFWTSCVLFAQQPAEKPNIVVILVDDMGFSDLGCYGSEIPTPNLDALAADGLRFTQFYNTGRCCPTRASLLTGLYPHQAGVGHMTDDKGVPGYRGRLNDSCVTIAEVLKPAGYFTIMSGKWHVGQNLGVTPWGRGFDRSLNPAAGGFYYAGSPRYDLWLNGESIKADDPRLPKNWYTTDLWTTFGLKFIDEALAEKKPFYLHLCHNAPHFPLQAPADAIEKFRGKYKAGWGAIRDARYARQIEMGIINKDWAKSPRPKDVKPWAEVPAEEKERFDHLMAVYAACVYRMDKAVGDLVAGLKERGVFDNTLILFMSDNGGNAESGPKGRTEGDPTQATSNWFCGESWAFSENTPFRLFKHYNHEGGIATPLIAHWPAGITAKNELRHTPTHLVDIMTTCVRVGGATYPKEFKGRPITPMAGHTLTTVFNGTGIMSRYLFWEHEGNAAVRLGDMKLVRKGRNAPWELYDMKADRTELHDLTAEQPEKAKELAAQWEAWAERANVKPYPNEGGTKKKGKGKKKAAAQE
ncbi:arylsulfatase [Prosthecobacter sp.]|uniref:arylsulfatase n=1 Tax=Prosthecobacter sp. TaxID=1965333 RepID=UPI001DE828D3|nr:arylsulfatase [Prosthecobacter sp.]MCB1278642.1 arylsulfatase [Prosthecobacter sp.]